MDRSSDAAWLPAARRGERWALEHLCRAYRTPVRTLCYRLLSRAEDAEDATQATFVRALRALPGFRGDASLKTWLYRIAVAEVIDTRRRRAARDARQAEVGSLDGVPSPDPLVQATDRLAVEAAMQRLKPDQQTILVLRYWEELSYEEIGAVLRVPVPLVAMRLHRARAAFRRHFEGQYDTPQMADDRPLVGSVRR